MTQERPPERSPPKASVDREPSCASQSHPPEALQSLKLAMRRARFDEAERAGVIADLRAARIGRLELLDDALRPLAAQIPPDVDLFDFGLMPGSNPRLFLDMIGFVEMGRDARTYRLLQDHRHGRRLLAESESIDRMVDAITDYVARRLLERDKALAALDVGEEPDTPPADLPPTPARRPRGGKRALRVAGAAFAMLIDLLGAIAFFAILLSLLYWAGWLAVARVQGRI